MTPATAEPLYISDLDGTLLDDQGLLPEFSRAQLRRLLQAGLRFTAASARSVGSIRRVLAGLPIRLPVIAMNGACIADFDTGRLRVLQALQAEVVAELLPLLRGRGLVPFLAAFDEGREMLHFEAIANDGMRWYHLDRIRAGDERLRQGADPRRLRRARVVSLTLIDRPDVLEELSLELRQRFPGRLETNYFHNHYSPGWYWLMIQDARATKDQAIRTLLDELGLAPQALTVFGDHINDLRMFRLAGRPVAVGNAVEELKRAASRVIGTNREEGVVRFLLQEAAGP